MGRPPIGKRTMTATERQRRWRKKRKRLAQSAEPDWQPKLPDEQAAIEKLTRERNQARRQLELAQRSAQPKAVGPDDQSPCSLCRKGRAEVKVMLKVPLPDFLLFLCNDCIDQMRRTVAAAWLIGEATME
jgi:hypothetical protein